MATKKDGEGKGGLERIMGGKTFSGQTLDSDITEWQNMSQVLQGQMNSVSYKQLMELVKGRDASKRDYFRLDKGQVDKLLDAVEAGISDTLLKTWYNSSAKKENPEIIRALMELNLGYDRMQMQKQWAGKDVNIDQLTRFVNNHINHLDERGQGKAVRTIEANRPATIEYVNGLIRVHDREIDPNSVTAGDLYGTLISTGREKEAIQNASYTRPYVAPN